MYKIRWGYKTKNDFIRLNNFLKNKSSKAAYKIKPTIKKGCEALRDNPELGTSLKDSVGRRIWRIPFGRDEYVIFYVPDHETKTINILKIYHSREDR